MASSESRKLKFVPFSSTVSPGFWYQLVDKKLNVFKLDDSTQSLNGFYSNSEGGGTPCQHSVEYDSFNIGSPPPGRCFKTHGRLLNKNTIEDFKALDKKKLLEREGDFLWENIKSGSAIDDPSLLATFFLLSFSDLKKYQFCYWFGFPTFLGVTDHLIIENAFSLGEKFSDSTILKLAAAVDGFQDYKGFFLLSFSGSSLDTVSCHSLQHLSSLLDDGKSVWFVFSDPSTLPNHPGWILRNFLLLITVHWAERLKGEIKVLCLRYHFSAGIRSISQSLWLSLKYDPSTVIGSFKQRPDPIGWERNKANKLRPRQVNLAENMDPKRLAESAVDLNLKLMRWRLMPSINLEKISLSKCLLLGSGTLGCNVARALLGWGVKKITLLDNGKVSFSNPVRQSLFEFSDCSTSGGRPKALAAAEKLTKIFPGTDASGVELSIPMPGHPVDTNAKTLAGARESVAKLQELISEHDVVFLLMDSRESRWLPTLLCSAQRKLVINAALGFDSYLVMRHGVDVGEDDDSGESNKEKLGCYFCNDVVAPGNSIKDRTLDQQCTVSRPGISMIAAAIAAELFVSVIQHKEQARYLPSESEVGYTDKDDFPLGKIPHQIRGFLSHYQTLLPTTFSFSKCTACSSAVLSRYRKDNVDFLLEVFNSPPNYLEDVTGLTQLHQETAFAEDEILEFSDDESI